MINTITLQGRITRDPEGRQTSSGKTYVSFSLAVQRNFKDSEGKYPADFIPCTAFEQRANFICSNAHKGDQLIVRGRLQTDKYQDQTGNSRTSYTVMVDEVSLVSQRSYEPANTPAPAYTPAPAQPQYTQPTPAMPESQDDDMLPFPIDL